MKMCGGVEVQLHTILTSALDGGGQLRAPAGWSEANKDDVIYRTSSTHKEVWLDNFVVMDNLEDQNEDEHRRAVLKLISQQCGVKKSSGLNWLS
jgi:hypothetical protein